MEGEHYSIRTYTGKHFYPTNPRVEDVCIEDIAWALSRECRFGNHCKPFYSVAQHSVIASYYVPPEDALTALLHDATEAYIGDMTRPLKRYAPMYKVIKPIEDRLMACIAQKFNLRFPFSEAIKKIDDSLILTEQRDIMLMGDEVWKLIREDAKPLPLQIQPMAESLARLKFKERFYQLYNK